MPQVQVQLKPTITTLTDQYLGRIAVALEKIADYLVNKDRKQILDSVDMMQDIVNRIRKNNCDDCDMTQTQLEDMIDALKTGIKEKYGDAPFRCPVGRSTCDQTNIVCEDCEHTRELYEAQSKGNDSDVWQCPAGRHTCEMNNCNSCDHLAYLLQSESENDGAK